MTKRKTMSLHAALPIIIGRDTLIPINLNRAAAALVEDIGEDTVGYFPDFWANGDGLEVSFKRVQKK
jgi:hypothetical protein